MTAQAEAAPAAAQQKTPIPGTQGKSFTAAAFGVWSAFVSAASSWAAGVAGHSWHVSVPFLAGWLVLLLVLLLTHHLTRIVSYSWHQEKANAAAEIATKAKIAEHMAERWLSGYVGQAFAAELAKLDGA